ncbi:alpha-amylase family glycosyl hydrolase [Halanaerobacter jeridensis]|uniref:Type I pullulanase n=1 Tax=Halanaerobacter jeridensis TaxID=706427 RepID=A0A938XVT2_9FIRM|nr:alpha-amylase family glycosyl hydrolase [Halanaerobacter jeridensis]MBM7557749.1 type I pullulanase [Halanaerobacter jeridensis]
MNAFSKDNVLVLLLVFLLTLLLISGCSSSDNDSDNINNETAKLNISVPLPNLQPDIAIQAITDDFSIDKIEVLVVNQNDTDDEYQRSKKINAETKKMAFSFNELRVGESYNITINAVDNSGYNVYSGTDTVTISNGSNIAKIDLDLLAAQGLVVNLKGIAEDSSGEVRLEPSDIEAKAISADIERVEFNNSLAANDYTLLIEINNKVVKTSEISLMPGRMTIINGIDMNNPDVYLKESDLEITWGQPGSGIGVSPRAKDFVNQIEVAINSTADVYYTLDGSNPRNNGQIYNGAITIGASMAVGERKTLKVFAEGEDGGVTKNSYQFTKKYAQANPNQTTMKLGALYTPQFTSFRIWSPDSKDVTVTVDGKEHQLRKLASFAGYEDIYHSKIMGDLEGAEYQFKIDEQAVRDPYGVMAKADKNVNIVMDVSSVQPDGGWSSRPELKQREDAVIYEMHVRDFTIDDSSGISDAKQGKFLGMVEEGTTIPGTSITTGIDHLKELGVTHVQIMPFYDFATEMYNWGYDPHNYNVPEDQYALDPDNYHQRVKEVKEMINQLHANGIRVIMDVVYNHTYSKEMFRGITNQYYTDGDWSGCGNSVDTSVAMVSRMIKDSLEYWVDEYNVDGFRFDLMGIYYEDAVKDWSQHLNEKYPERNLLLYGEPWAASGTPGDTVSYGDIAKLASGHIGSFNDQIRNAIIGSNKDALVDSYMFNRGTKAPIIKDVVTASNLGGFDFADPEQTINYVSAHDNLALWDNIKYEFANDDNLDLSTQKAYATRIDKFAMGIVGTSQGIPFMHGGDEMLRTKVPVGKDITNQDVFHHVENSYNAPDEYNKIDWNWKTEYDNDSNGLNDVYEYYQDLIALRKNHPAFRMNTYDQIDRNVSSYVADDNSKVVIAIIDGAKVGDNWEEIRVIYNSGADYSYKLPAGEWEKVFTAEGRVTEEVSGTVNCEGTAVTIFAGQSSSTSVNLTIKGPLGEQLAPGTEVIASVNSGVEKLKKIDENGQIKFSDLAVQDTLFSLEVTEVGKTEVKLSLSETINNFEVSLESLPYVDGEKESKWEDDAKVFTDPTADNFYGSSGDSIDSIYLTNNEEKLYAYISLDSYTWGKEAMFYIDVIKNQSGITDFSSTTDWSWGNAHAILPDSVEGVLSVFGDRSGYGFYTFLAGDETEKSSVVDIAYKDGNIEMSVPLTTLDLNSGDQIKVFASINDGPNSIHDVVPGTGTDDVISDGERVFDFSNLTTETSYVIGGGTPRSNEKEITDFELAEERGTVTINNNNKTVKIEVTSETDLSNLTPIIEVSDEATVDPESGIEQNFEMPVTYTVTAENGTKQGWLVMVTKNER